jgi:hypothetical protein
MSGRGTLSMSDFTERKGHMHIHNGSRLVALPWIVAIAAGMVVISTSSTILLASDTILRWDIVNVDPPYIGPSGMASAEAHDHSRISLFSASGTIDTANRRHVTGGGSWEIRDGNGVLVDSGSFDVTRLLHWVVAPGTFPDTLIDQVGDLANARPGLAVLKVYYSGGDEGTVVVSCNLMDTPASVFEGITATKGFVDYFHPVAGGFTLFHRMP